MMIMLIVFSLLFQGGFLFAQEKKPETERPRPVALTHVLGDQAVAFSLGAYIPLFFYRTADGVVENTNLFVGAKGALEYFSYLSNNFTIGIEIVGGFAFSPNFNIYWSLPITAKASFVIPIGVFELFFSLAAGVDFERFLEGSRMDFVLRPQISFHFPIDPSITLGVSVAYWFVPQIANADQEAYKPGQSRLGNFLDTALTLIYHF
jgi:hypothetical protein